MKTNTLLTLVLLIVFNSTAVAKGHQTLDPLHPIILKGNSLTYNHQVIKLDDHTFFLDGSLSEEEAAQSPYVFRTFQEVNAHLTDGTAESPMRVLIAPWVYWINDPDTPKTVRTPDRSAPIGMYVRCNALHLIGLNPDPQNIVLASARGQSQGSYGNFTMFQFEGNDLLFENLTMGNYCNIDLEFPLLPRLARTKRSSAITQAHVAYCHGDRIIARNVRFMSRLNMNPLGGARRILFDRCHMESTDDALTSTGVYLHCTLDFYGQKPFWNSDKAGAVFMDCDFTIHHDADRTYFCKSQNPVNLIDCRYHTQKGIYAGYTHTPADWLRSYQYHVTMNGQPYLIGAEKPYNSISLDRLPLLGAYRLAVDDSIVYNTFNLLRGDDDWDPQSIKKTVEEVGIADGKDYGNMATALLVTPHTGTIQTGSNAVTLNAQLLRHAGFAMNNERIHWRIAPDDSRFVALSTTEGNTCTVSSMLETDEPRTVNIIAYTDNGLEGCCELLVKPSTLPAPSFVKKPTVALSKGKATVSYRLALEGRKDLSLITWYRVKGNQKIPVAVSRLNQPEYTYTLSPEDIGYRLMASVEPKNCRSEAGKAITAISGKTVTRNLIIPSSTLETDFQTFPTALQRDIIPGFWTVDSYKPEDTNAYGWQADNQNETWYYGTGINGCKGTGLYALKAGGRLRYTPLPGSYGDMDVELLIDPSKTAGQGFGAALMQYLDIIVKMDTRTMTGYALRIIRTTKYANAVDFLFVRYDNGHVTEISQPVSTICYLTGCTVRISTRGTEIRATASTSSVLPKNDDPNLKPTVDLSATIQPTGHGGFGIMYTGGAGEGANMLHHLKIGWAKQK